MAQRAQPNIPMAPPSISTTETFLLECSRSNSLIDKNNLEGGDENASWINQTNNFQIKKGDSISIEMVALNLSQTTSPMEFSGYNVILEGAEVKPYVDNRVVLEVGYYIVNNQSYSCNLPLAFHLPPNNKLNSAGAPVGRIAVNVKPEMGVPAPALLASINQYPGFGMGFGCPYNIPDPVYGTMFQLPVIPVAQQGNALSSLNSYRIVGFTGENYAVGYVNSPTPALSSINSVILERDYVNAVPPINPAIPNSPCSYKTFLNWEANSTTGDEGFFGKVGMRMRFELDNGEIVLSPLIIDIRKSEALFPLEAAVDPLRVQVCFAIGFGSGLTLVASCEKGRSTCLVTPDIRYNDIFRSQGLGNWGVNDWGGNTEYTQNRQNSGITDFFSNGLQGTTETDTADVGTIPQNGLAYVNYSYRETWGGKNDAGALSGMTFLAGGGIGSNNRQQGTDNIPYILTRNDYMGTQPKANCESLGRYKTWCPDLAPLTSFIVLEAKDLLMDATALATKINEKLHASLPGVGNNTNDIASYQTNIYGFTKRYKKSSQLLPYNQTAGYWPQLPYQQSDGVVAGAGAPPAVGGGGFGHPGGAVVGASILTYKNNQLWNTIDTYFSGGTKQIIPANIQPGWNGLAMIGYNATISMNMEKYTIDRILWGDVYPSFETTYLRTCKRPPDYYGDACSWNNVIHGNKGVKDIYKHMWGDIFNKIPVWDGNTWEVLMTDNPSGSRNYSRPIILNSQLQNYTCTGRYLNFQPTPTAANPQQDYYGEASFDTTLLVKNQMIFTNVYYDEAAMLASGDSQLGYGDITNLLKKLVRRQRDYEIFINTANTKANTYKKQQEDVTGFAIELDLGMTNDFETTKWSAVNNPNPPNYQGGSISMEFHWENTGVPAPVTGGAYPSWNPLYLNNTLNPTKTNTAFGSYNTKVQAPPPIAAQATSNWDWGANQNTARPTGRIWIQSRYDPAWKTTSNTGGEKAPYPGGVYPQVPFSVPLDDTQCNWVDADGNALHDDTWSKENNMGIYPYEYTDTGTPPKKHIFMAFRVAQVYKAANIPQINSDVIATWRLGRLSYGLPFGFSPAQYDNYCIVPMNPDNKKVDITECKLINGDTGLQNLLEPVKLNTGLIQNCNGYIAVGADNPTFTYNLEKSRMELSKTYKPTQLSPFNTTGNKDASDLPSLGETVAIFNDACPDAVYSPPINVFTIPPTGDGNIAPVHQLNNPSGGGIETNQNQRSEETGIFIYKVWLPDENWNPPTDINLYSYWSNNSPESSTGADGSRFVAPLVNPPGTEAPNFEQTPDATALNGNPAYAYRDNQDGTENNRESIIANMTEATVSNYKGCLLSKLGFELEQFMPQQGRQWNRYSVNGYNNPQPDLIATQNTKPLILNCQSNLTLNTAFNVEYHVNPPTPLFEEVSAIQGYTKTTPQPDLETVVPEVPAFTTTTPQPDLETIIPEVPAYTTTTPQPDLETLIPAIPSYEIPQPDLETIVPAVPASSTIYNTTFDNYTEQLVSTDINQTSQNTSARVINLSQHNTPGGLVLTPYPHYMTFTDDGGTGNYTNSNNRSLTFDAGAGNYIWVRFDSFKFEHASSTMYDRAGMTASDVLTDLSLASANLNTTTAPLLSPALINSATSSPLNAWSGSYGSSSSTNNYILPSRSDTTPVNGSNFASNVGVWFQIKARYMRFWFFSDGSVVDNGWNMDICVEYRIPAVPSYIIYTPQPPIVVPEVPAYIEYTPQPDLVVVTPAVPAYSIFTPQPDLVVVTPAVPAYVTSIPQPDLVETFPTVPAYLQSSTAVEPPASGLPNYGLGFSNNQPVIVTSTDSVLTATNPIESTNSPFFQIYSTICPHHYSDNGQDKGIMFYCMKNYVSGNYSYGYGSTFAHTATTSYNLDYIQTEIRNPISGRLMKVLQSNSVITYKVTRPIVLAPDAYDEQGIPYDPTTEPFQADIGADTDTLFNIIEPIQGGTQSGATKSSAPPSGGEPPILPPIMFNAQNEVINLDVQPQVDADIRDLNTFELSPFRAVGDISALEQKEMGEDGDQETKSGGFKQNSLAEAKTRVAPMTPEEKKARNNARRREARANETEAERSARLTLRRNSDRIKRDERRQITESTPAQPEGDGGGEEKSKDKKPEDKGGK